MHDQSSEVGRAVQGALAGDWQVTAQVYSIRDGWKSSRQIPTFALPRMIAPTMEEARAKVAQIVNPYGDYQVSFDLYAIDGNGEAYRAFMQSGPEPVGCVLCRLVGHGPEEPCKP